MKTEWVNPISESFGSPTETVTFVYIYIKYTYVQYVYIKQNIKY